MHPLLARQVKKHLGKDTSIPKELHALIAAVDEAYHQNDTDRKMMDRSMELVSQELLQANEQMRAEMKLPDRAREELKKTASVLRSILNSTRDGMLVVSNGGVILFFNTRLLELFDISAKVIETRGYEAFLSAASVHLADPEGFLDRAHELFEAAEEETLDVLLFEDGRLLERATVPHRVDGEPVGRVLFFRDVTQRRRLEEQLRHSQKMEAVGRLAGGLAHDLNNLLTVISGNSELMLGICPDSLRLGIEEIERASEQAAGLIKQLLAFSRKQVLRPTVLDLNLIVREMSRMMQRLLGDDIELVVTLDDDLGPIKADRGQIEAVIMNLAVNARDAMPEGGKLSILTRHLAHLGQVSLAVRDSGGGMTPEVQARIFEPFFTTKELGRGTGFGLATVFGIVTQSGGTIAAESSLGQGSTFDVRFPVSTEPVHAAGRRAEPRVGGGNETILVVEDESMVRGLLGRALRKEGYEILEAASAEEAMRLAASYEGSIHLLLTDVVMPGVQGPELARHLRAQRSKMRVLFMSGHLYGPDQSQSLDGPLLHKPFRLQALPGRIREILDS